jgi:L-lactate dehydrogenase complex protein LldE
MQVALMVPCYIDMFYPHVGIATLELLEKLGCRCCVSAGADLLDCRPSGSGREDSDRSPLARSEYRSTHGVKAQSLSCDI